MDSNEFIIHFGGVTIAILSVVLLQEDDDDDDDDADTKPNC